MRSRTASRWWWSLCAGKDSEITDSLTELRVYSFLISCLLAVLYTNLNRGQDTHSIDTQLYCTVQEDTAHRASPDSLSHTETDTRSLTNQSQNQPHPPSHAPDHTRDASTVLAFHFNAAMDRNLI